MWASSIRPEDIRLPDGSTQLDAVMGRVYRRVLTHKGIEFEGLFYSSPELNDLRISAGSNLEVEIRVDESDIGSILRRVAEDQQHLSCPGSQHGVREWHQLMAALDLQEVAKRKGSVKPEPVRLAKGTGRNPAQD